MNEALQTYMQKMRNLVYLAFFGGMAVGAYAGWIITPQYHPECRVEAPTPLLKGDRTP